MLRKRRLNKHTLNDPDIGFEADSSAKKKRVNSLRLEKDSFKRKVNPDSTKHRPTRFKSRTKSSKIGEYSHKDISKLNDSSGVAIETEFCRGNGNIHKDEVGLRNGNIHNNDEYSVDLDESDYFEVIQVETKTDVDEPDCVSPESPWYRLSASSDMEDLKVVRNPFFNMKWMNDKKDLNSPVYILHRYATDNHMLGDKFGINILTDDSGQKDGYYRHFCTKLISGSPADKMAIKNKDELVLVDGRFVPQLDHKELIQLFSRVPVDGVTKFELVLRRKVQKHSKTWEWFETSAILVPELNEEPLTKDTKVTRLHNNLVDKRTWQRYKVIGTEYFLTIGASGVGVDVLYNDNTKDKHKMVQKHAIICEDEHDNNKMDFLASLACVDERHFVSIDPINKAVVTVMEEAFFQYRSSGSDIFFKQKDMYLNCTNNTVVARETQQFFAEFPMPGHKDVVDDIDGGYVSTSPPKSLTLDKAPKRVTRSMSRQASLDTMFCGIDLNMKKI